MHEPFNTGGLCRLRYQTSVHDACAILRTPNGTYFNRSWLEARGNEHCYPKAVAESVANKLAATQVLEQTTIEIQTTKAKAQIREADAEGIAKAMETINQKLTPLYVQYEAIQAQEKMVSSPNHTEVFIPVGPMGVPVVGMVFPPCRYRIDECLPGRKAQT